MEGLSYWIFLAAMYLLSAFMKKRQQQVTSSSKKNKSKVFQNKFFEDLFQDLKEVGVEPEDPILEQFEDSSPDKIVVEEEKNILDEEFISIPGKEPSDNLESFSKPDNLVSPKESLLLTKESKKKLVFSKLFNNIDDLKQGIIMKEILDKPRAIRKNIF
jgi:hypothetical protein